MTKKIVSWILSLTLILGLVGCGTQTSKQEHSHEDISAEQGGGLASADAQNKNSESGDFDVANETDTTIDFSKYEDTAKNVTQSAGDINENGSNQAATEEMSGNNADNTRGVCYFTISCTEILDNMDMLAPGREAFVPANGLILAKSEVPFEKGETVFDVLKRVTRQCGISMEFSYFPLYESMYIEGIGNLYEKDCGAASGWFYYVNGVRPNYGVSKYVLEDQDVVEFYYTCG